MLLNSKEYQNIKKEIALSLNVDIESIYNVKQPLLNSKPNIWLVSFYDRKGILIKRAL